MLAKRGQAVARCCVEEVQPFRILEITGCLPGQAGQVVNVDLFPHPLGKLLNQKTVFGTLSDWNVVLVIPGLRGVIRLPMVFRGRFAERPDTLIPCLKTYTSWGANAVPKTFGPAQ